MMPVIRVDDDVMDALKRKAVEYGLVFGSPNEVLRVTLGVEQATFFNPDSGEVASAVPSPYFPSTDGTMRRDGMADPLTVALIQSLVQALRTRTADPTIEARWQPKGERYSLFRSNGRFGTLEPYQPRNRRIMVGVPAPLVKKAGIPLTLFDHHWPSGYYGAGSYWVYINYNGSTPEAAQYQRALDILCRAWGAR